MKNYQLSYGNHQVFIISCILLLLVSLIVGCGPVGPVAETDKAPGLVNIQGRKIAVISFTWSPPLKGIEEEPQIRIENVTGQEEWQILYEEMIQTHFGIFTEELKSIANVISPDDFPAEIEPLFDEALQIDTRLAEGLVTLEPSLSGHQRLGVFLERDRKILTDLARVLNVDALILVEIEYSLYGGAFLRVGSTIEIFDNNGETLWKYDDRNSPAAVRFREGFKSNLVRQLGLDEFSRNEYFSRFEEVVNVHTRTVFQILQEDLENQPHKTWFEYHIDYGGD